jgi:type IV pilus assembly protein PilM
VRLGISSSRIGVRVLEVPRIDDPKLLENAIRFRAQETLPISVHDAVLDSVVLGDDVDDNDEPISRVLLAFAHRELIDRYVESCRLAKLKLVGIDFDAFALLRAVRPDPAPENIAVVTVAIGHERTIFAVSDGEVCDFTRVLEWGGSWLDIAVARALGLTPSEAAPIKHALSLEGPALHTELSNEQVDEARAAIRQELHALVRELVSSLQFYQARPGSLDIAEIVLTGGGAQLLGLDTVLSRMVGVPVRIGDPFGRVRVRKGFARPADTGALAIAIGLGIDD